MLSTSPVIEELEDPHEWERHLRAMTEAFEPAGYLEEVLVGRIALLTWRLRRVIPYERDMTIVDHAFHYDSSASLHSRRGGEAAAQDLPPSEAWEVAARRVLPFDQTLATVMRYESHLHRLWLQTLHELEAIQLRRQGGHAPLARLDISAPPAN